MTNPMTRPTPPHTTVEVVEVRFCDLPHLDEVPIARYDAKIRSGQWANLCGWHFNYEDCTLGLGKGQRFIYTGKAG